MPKQAPRGTAAPAATPPARTPIPRRTAAPEDTGGDETTGNETESKADAFDNAQAAALGIPPGDHEARILEMVYEKNAKGESVKITYEATTADEDNEAYGKKSSQWYQVFGKNGEVGKGIGFLKADLEKLGVDAEGQKFANLEETLAQISEAQPLVNIRVKKNDQWTNVYLQSLVAEGE